MRWIGSRIAMAKFRPRIGANSSATCVTDGIYNWLITSCYFYEDLQCGSLLRYLGIHQSGTHGTWECLGTPRDTRHAKSDLHLSLNSPRIVRRHWAHVALR